MLALFKNIQKEVKIMKTFDIGTEVQWTKHPAYLGIVTGYKNFKVEVKLYAPMKQVLLLDPEDLELYEDDDNVMLKPSDFLELNRFLCDLALDTGDIDLFNECSFYLAPLK